MVSVDEESGRLHRDLGFRRLSRTWAKLEILLGLSAFVAGLLCGVRAAAGAGVDWRLAVGGTLLAALGGYLAMAGHRSHAYQSQTRLAAYLLSRLAARDDESRDHRPSPSAPRDSADRDAP